MCGIVGSINFPLPYQKIKNEMFHRGPDEQNSYKHESIDFYHLRLAIQDIACGQQPMHLSDKYSIIYNGEIYNHKALRKQFNLSCLTESDTETILHLYEKMGIDFLVHLDGMFAIAIYDKVNNKLVLARDRAGKKPLYLYEQANVFVFASELNTLKAILPLTINTEAVKNFLRLGCMYRKDTPYNNVTELENGHYFTINLNNFSCVKTQWWSIHDFYTQPSSHSFQESLNHVDELLKTAVKRRVETSDLEVGSFLSGGIDSGLVTAMAAELKPSLKTFTVAFEGAYNEAPLAKLVANKYKTDHTEISISFKDLKNDIEKIILNYGEPFADASAIPSYYVSKEAKKHLTVILNGDGADELFAGYRRYVPFAKFDFFNTSNGLKQIAKGLLKILPESHNKKDKYNYLYRLVHLAGQKGIDTYLSATTDIFDATHFIESNNTLSKAFIKDFESISSSNLDGLSKIMNLDFNTILFSALLVKMDIATMANSLEGRSPFLSKELLEYAPTILSNFKIQNTRTKHLLRELAKKYLPIDLVDQPKRGFEIPLKKWIDEDLNEYIWDTLSHASAIHKQILTPDIIKKLKEGNKSIPAEKRAKMIWTIFCLEVWYKNL
jgi:asparagine synthase (glutamine-hydrolysing)